MVCVECTQSHDREQGEGVGVRLARLYPSLRPIIAWLIKEVPKGVLVEYSPSDTGDVCHAGLIFKPGDTKSQQDNAGKKFFLANALPAPPDPEATAEYYVEDMPDVVRVADLKTAVERLWGISAP